MGPPETSRQRARVAYLEEIFANVSLLYCPAKGSGWNEVNKRNDTLQQVHESEDGAIVEVLRQEQARQVSNLRASNSTIEPSLNQCAACTFTHLIHENSNRSEEGCQELQPAREKGADDANAHQVNNNGSDQLVLHIAFERLEVSCGITDLQTAERSTESRIFAQDIFELEGLAWPYHQHSSPPLEHPLNSG